MIAHAEEPESRAARLVEEYPRELQIQAEVRRHRAAKILNSHN